MDLYCTDDQKGADLEAKKSAAGGPGLVEHVPACEVLTVSDVAWSSECSPGVCYLVLLGWLS